MKSLLWISRTLPIAVMLFCLVPAHASPLRLTSGVTAPYFLPNQQGFLDLLIPEMADGTYQRIYAKTLNREKGQ